MDAHNADGNVFSVYAALIGLYRAFSVLRFFKVGGINNPAACLRDKRPYCLAFNLPEPVEGASRIFSRSRI